jgi:hypothetical protein
MIIKYGALGSFFVSSQVLCFISIAHPLLPLLFAKHGDFHILFLLFAEGLNLSPERLRKLGSFFSLGTTQLLLSIGVILFRLFLGRPLLFQVLLNPSIPINPLVVQLLKQPVVVFAFAIAAAGALSSSTFVLPILKEKGWKDPPDGIAVLSILLIQNLAVVPLLGILPLIANVKGGVTSAATGGGGGRQSRRAWDTRLQGHGRLRGRTCPGKRGHQAHLSGCCQQQVESVVCCC